MMEIHFFNNHSESNAINKVLTDETLFTGTLKENCSVTNPSILINTPNPIEYNYAYIIEFNRYYFIEEITSLRNGLWEIRFRVDVLMSFRSEILDTYAIIDHADSSEISEYMNSEIWKSLVKTMTDIINFPDGLLETGEYILITAGG